MRDLAIPDENHEKPREEEYKDTPKISETGISAIHGRDIQARSELQKSEMDVMTSEGYKLKGDAEEIAKLRDSHKRLERTDTGKPIADSIKAHGTTTRFGKIESNAIAQFEPGNNRITIHDSQRDSSPEVISAHLAHEGTHVQWDRPDSIDQEYHAFKNQADVWNEVKGGQSDDQCDQVSNMIALGEADAKYIIRQQYQDQDLPEY
jgi:hypothetical protein